MDGQETLSSADLEGLVSSAEKNADSEEEETVKAAVLSILALKTAAVTTLILVDTQAGKRVRKLSKHSNSEVSAAALEVVTLWKQVIKGEQEGGVSRPALITGQKRTSSEILGKGSGELNGGLSRRSQQPEPGIRSFLHESGRILQGITLRQDPAISKSSALSQKQVSAMSCTAVKPLLSKARCRFPEYA